MENEDYTNVTLKINSVVMDYLKEKSEENIFTVEEIIEWYINQVLYLYMKATEEEISTEEEML
ncbi:MAG: hypothetical protein IJC74_08975 [Clostridia bacterium]|nr:hypothetical protein [Clostridia bacterium]